MGGVGGEVGRVGVGGNCSLNSNCLFLPSARRLTLITCVKNTFKSSFIKSALRKLNANWL